MSSIPRLILQMATLLVVAFLCAVWANFLSGPSRRLASVDVTQKVAPQAPPQPVVTDRPQTPPQPSPAKPAPQMRFEWNPEQPSRDITSREAAEAYRQGFPFLDARRSVEYREGHIRGALGMSVWEADIDERLARFDAMGRPLKAPVVLYCSGGDCQDSQLLASRLLGLGYRHLLIYQEGFPDWVTKGRPIRQGAQP
ncbi:rhodanese-like domain-containing protein [Holophaga foetida]|uniref:rhodanese-like domain-containing protein n=1 Tax=Holophaga foetida TaxID=35839 RepID=UPI0002472616|nr:rhodanese-like domain-containing protein [Holophaga foetida]